MVQPRLQGTRAPVAQHHQDIKQRWGMLVHLHRCSRSIQHSGVCACHLTAHSVPVHQHKRIHSSPLSGHIHRHRACQRISGSRRPMHTSPEAPQVRVRDNRCNSHRARPPLGCSLVRHCSSSSYTMLAHSMVQRSLVLCGHKCTPPHGSVHRCSSPLRAHRALRRNSTLEYRALLLLNSTLSRTPRGVPTTQHWTSTPTVQHAPRNHANPSSSTTLSTSQGNISR